MSVLPIRIYGDPVLHTPAEPVAEITDATGKLVADMFETMAAAPGVGLAAPQVGVAQRIFVYSWDDESGVSHRGVAINPQLWQAPLVPEHLEALDEDEEEEGCLSVPGERFALRRSPTVLLRALNLEGQQYEIRAEGWLARIFQHEYDHLDGVIYVDRLEYAAHKQAFKAMRKRGWNVPGNSWLPGKEHLEG